MRDYYKVLLVGSSGKGKTYSARNLDPIKTGFVNIEDKPLPFKNNFKYHKRVTTYLDALNAIAEFAREPEVEVIFIDSFSAYADLVLAEARRTKKGFDIWSMYNEEIGRFNQLVKKVQKEVVVTAHYEILAVEGASEKRVKVKAKEWEGQIEKDYTIVLYADNKYDEDSRPKYTLHLVGEGLSAKCPPDIFGEDVLQVPNDMKEVINKIVEFSSN